MIEIKTYTEPPICKKEILRYAGCKDSLQFSAENAQAENIELLLEECLEEILSRLSYKVCYIELPLTINAGRCDLGYMQVESRDLVKNLQGCEKVLLFGATIGVEIDRLIAKYGHISPAKAVMFQAIGAERIEALCDVFCADIERLMLTEKEKCNANVNATKILRPRFSPGYGDLSMEVQRDIFRILNCSKNIGISLNDGLLMTPSKSVTAFAGIGQTTKTEPAISKCASCSNTGCAYRKI